MKSSLGHTHEFKQTVSVPKRHVVLVQSSMFYDKVTPEGLNHSTTWSDVQYIQADCTSLR